MFGVSYQQMENICIGTVVICFLETNIVIQLTFTIWPPKAIEVLLRNKAFVIKKVAPSGEGASVPTPKGQLTWSKFGGVAGAWEVAKEKANWPSDLSESETRWWIFVWYGI